MTTPFQDSEYHFIILSALRYALYRHTYIPGVVAAYIKRNWQSIPPNTQYTITKDLQEHLRYFAAWQTNPSWQIDYATWQNLYNHITKTANRKETT